MKPRRREAQDAQDTGARQYRLGAEDGPEEPLLGGALRKARLDELDARGPQQRHKKSNDGGQDPGASLEAGDAPSESLAIVARQVEGHDAAGATCLPGGDGGSRDTEQLRLRRRAGS